MRIESFLQLNVGEWLSQRSSHSMATRTSESERLTVVVSYLDPSHQSTPENSSEQTQSGGLEVTWVGDLTRGSLKMLFLPDATGLQGAVHGLPTGSAAFQFNPDDEVLTLTSTDQQNGSSILTEERIWFPGENFRVRNCTIVQDQVLVMSTFYTEVRKVAKPT